MIVKTRNGLFTNEGYGGGVFNLNTAFGSYEGNPSGVSGLGNIPATARSIPGGCTTPAYLACEAEARNQARLQCEYCVENPNDWHCEGFNGNVGDCLNRLTAQMSWDNCVPNFCAASDPSQANKLPFTAVQPGDPCSSANTIRYVQHSVGVKADGIWGPLSQEGYNTNKAVFGSSYCDIVPGCSGQTPVGTECGSSETAPAPIPTPQPKPQPTPIPSLPPEPEIQESKGAALFLGALAVAALVGGTALLLGKGVKK